MPFSSILWKKKKKSWQAVVDAWRAAEAALVVDDGLGRWGSCDGMCRRAVLDDRNGRRNDDPVENTRGP